MKKDEGTKKWSAIAIIAILGLSSVGFLTFYITPSGGVIRENGQKFDIQSDGTYLTKLGGAKIAVTYLPSTLSTYPVDPEVFNRIRNAQTIFITSQFPHTYQESFGALSFDLSNLLADIQGINVVLAYTTQVGTAQVATCAQSTPQVPVISIENRAGTGIFMDGDCLLISGERPQDFVRMRDLMIYGIFGVI